MSGSGNRIQENRERLRRKTRLAQLEADMAYFQARLEILGEPHSANKEAERRAFRLLHRILGEKVVRERRRMRSAG